MARYVDVENIKKLFDEEFKKTRKLIDKGETHLDNLAEGFLEADRVLYKLPTADVVEVVRCKDCKRCYEKRTKRNNQLMRFCMRMDRNEYQVNANDFCSYGKRKEVD